MPRLEIGNRDGQRLSGTLVSWIGDSVNGLDARQGPGSTDPRFAWKERMGQEGDTSAAPAAATPALSAASPALGRAPAAAGAIVSAGFAGGLVHTIAVTGLVAIPLLVL